ncbi:hypothetical protein O4H49_03990 [Kiloniella laminariae]|uniref:EthD domain-containing protein n=1 Tax=Kiloniella laminariae TaxID=454162 RepID=A0ABT4LFP2_9PROT|nr:hypothetical protein [Kiloniella laminariae]MCZ4279925.1 hypothetical protein [Kiloniella laminariae]
MLVDTAGKQDTDLAESNKGSGTTGGFTAMGFARYEKQAEVTGEELIEACLTWRREFLYQQPGIARHWFLGNLKGHFADAVLADTPEALQQMGEKYVEYESSHAFMALLKPETVRMSPNRLLSPVMQMPENFSCIEFGSFRPRPGESLSPEALQDVSTRIEQLYLARQPELRAHLMGQVDENTWSEISFVQNLGAARRICNGYIGDPTCQELLALFDPASVDLDFWFLLA